METWEGSCIGQEKATISATTPSSRFLPVAQEVVNLVKLFVVVRLLVSDVNLQPRSSIAAMPIEAGVKIVETVVNQFVNEVSNVLKKLDEAAPKANLQQLVAAPILASMKLLVESTRQEIKLLVSVLLWAPPGLLWPEVVTPPGFRMFYLLLRIAKKTPMAPTGMESITMLLLCLRI